MTARIWSLIVVIVAALALHAGLPASAQAPTPAKPADAAPAATPPAKPDAAPSATPPAKPDAAAPATAPAKAAKPKATPGKRFASAEEATQALVAALRSGETKASIAVLGSDARTLLSSGDAVSDRQSREKFLKAYDAANRLIPYGTRTVLEVGTDYWPFPIPIVKDGDRWRFDTQKGREEILARRIGRNELYTIETCLAVVDAQREYYAQDRNGDGILEYAQQFASTPGKHDGLYWPTQPGEPPSPLGALVARARAEGYRRSKSGPTPLHGYIYRLLTAQGPAAPDGAYSYIAKGHMIAGFAVVAHPAQYGASGVMTFIVNHDGVVYQKDLGPKTATIAGAMRTFNPDAGWTKSELVEISPPTPE
jgi:DUF2950 family protein